MSNPARELAQIIQGWVSSKEKVAYMQRGLQKGGDGWPTQMRAAELLFELERSLLWMKHHRGADVEVFLEAFPKWRNIVFHYAEQWQQAPTSDDGLPMLRACAPLLDANGRTDFDVERLREGVGDIGGVIDADQSLSPTLKLYVARLVAHVNGLLDVYETTGVFELADAIAQLQIFMDAAAFQTEDEDNRSKFEKFGDFLKHPFVNTSATLIGTGGINAVALLGPAVGA